MSDTPNMATTASNLASKDEFDARLLRTDEARWLASRYAPEAGRRIMVAVYLFNQELQRALQVREPMLAKIRIQWWRETLDGLAAGTVRRHDLSQELADAIQGRNDLLPALQRLVDRYDDVADDHLQDGGHDGGAAHAARHMALEAELVELTGMSLVRALDDGERHALRLAGEAHVAVRGQLADASARWTAAQKAVRTLKPALWPAVAHLAVDDSMTALGKRWRVFTAVLSRRLPARRDAH